MKTLVLSIVLSALAAFPGCKSSSVCQCGPSCHCGSGCRCAELGQCSTSCECPVGSACSKPIVSPDTISDEQGGGTGLSKKIPWWK